MINHLIAFFLGFVLDQIIGDPMNFPHPIRLIGSLISFLDKKLLGDTSDSASSRKTGKEKALGLILCFLVIGITVLITGVISVVSYMLNTYLGILVEAVLTCYILAARSLKVESMKVYYALREGDIEKSRYAVSMIVGRDTKCLDEAGITRAAIETVAENTSDGVIAPVIYTFLGGPILGFAYKSINTMDSMVGYHNDRYEHFGFFAAKLDDIVNFLPARISALLMILAAFVLGRDFSGRNAFKIFLRDRYNHKSPNSAQTESVCAGALGVRLAGDAYYFGKLVKKPFIGDDLRQVEPIDIKRACKLMLCTTYLCVIILYLLAGGITFFME